MRFEEEYLGLRILCQPADDADGQSTDIIFVHGFDGHPEKTWTNDDGTFWLRDLLPFDIPSARILTFGYHADTLRLLGDAIPYLHNHVQSFITALREHRQKTKRPLILVSHSLGGIICKAALVHASRDSRDNELLPDVGGLLFLGTPHGDTSMRWAETIHRTSLANKSSSRLFWPTSRPLDDFLNNINQDFLGMIRDGSLPYVKICTMYETQAVRGIGLVVNGASSTLPTPTSFAIGLNADHNQMTKFATQDDANYRLISVVLKTWISQLKKEKRSNAGLQVIPNVLEHKSVVPTATSGLVEILSADHKQTDQRMFSMRFMEEGASNEMVSLLNAGRLANAEKLQRQISEDYESRNEATSRSGLIARTNLAAILGRRGKWDEAEILLQEVLKEYRSFEETDTVQLTVMVNLAFTLANVNYLEESESLLREVLTLHDKVTTEPMILLTAKTDLAMLLTMQNKFPESKALLRVVLMDTKSLLGEHEPDLIRALLSMGIMYTKFKRFDDAEKYFRDASTVSMNVYGENHPLSQILLELTVQTNISAGRPNAAMEFQQVIYNSTRLRFGPGNKTSRSAALQYAFLLRVCGLASQASTIEETELKYAREFLGDEHPETLATAKAYIRSLRQDKKTIMADYIEKQILQSSAQTQEVEHEVFPHNNTMNVFDQAQKLLFHFDLFSSSTLKGDMRRDAIS